MKQLLLIAFTVFLVSCGTTVNYDYDTKTDFSVFKSYDFYPEIDSGLSQLDNKRIIKTIDSILLQRGFVKSNHPDFLINYYVKEFVTNSGTTLGIGIGGGGRHGGVGVSGGIPVGGDIYKQKLTLDFIDKKQDKLIWQAVSNNKLKVKSSPSQKDRYYNQFISNILKGFPPKK